MTKPSAVDVLFSLGLLAHSGEDGNDLPIGHIGHLPYIPEKPTNLELSGALGPPGKDPLQPPKSAPPPKKQPSIFWKAFGFALKQKFALSGSLADDERALFIAEPGQVGVPAGNPFPHEATNYQLFIKADTMQALNYPTFTIKGNSYFGFLNSYLCNAGMDQATDPTVLNASKALEAARRAKDASWEAGRKHYHEESSVPAANAQAPGTLVDFLRDDKAYQSAWHLEQEAEKTLHTLRSPQMEDLSNKIQMLREADKRLEYEKGNNMPVVTISEDWVARLLQNPDLKADSLIDPAWIYYRPAYALPEYEKDASAWAKAAVGTLSRDGPYMIPLAGVWDRDWADLGHPLLDQAKPAEKLTDEQKEILSSLTVNLTYLQEPYSYEVNTGEWGVHDFQHFQLPSTAPE
ncbi:hypothetical protein MN608_07544 [Microdochium nivale]|nr:hypothetical protein MN608_07544 [Microdochium nivale]